jgi:hypothetical protein
MVFVQKANLRSKSTKSCGCYRRDLHLTHGQGRTSEYGTWNQIIGRCMNPKHAAYDDYGGRGITVCQEWLLFERFYADMGPRPPGHSIDRRDNDGPYAPWNCRWASRSTQANNTRANILLTHDGRTQTIGAWSRESGIDYTTLAWRLKRGWPVEVALTRPPSPKRH